MYTLTHYIRLQLPERASVNKWENAQCWNKGFKQALNQGQSYPLFLYPKPSRYIKPYICSINSFPQSCLILCMLINGREEEVPFYHMLLSVLKLFQACHVWYRVFIYIYIYLTISTCIYIYMILSIYLYIYICIYGCSSLYKSIWIYLHFHKTHQFASISRPAFQTAKVPISARISFRNLNFSPQIKLMIAVKQILWKQAPQVATS